MVATTVLLSFISFWRAAAIVLNDLGSSAFYAAGIAEQAYGKAAPWFILAVMLFANAVRMVYIESCSMFTRGGVYRVVKEAMGGPMARLAVAALMFDYMLTGPISSVSAGQYLVGLTNDSLDYVGIATDLPRDGGAMIFAVLVILYFWRKNIIGLRESSEKALRIMYVVAAMVVMLLVWSGITLLVRGGQLPPLPTLENLHFKETALGWLKGTTLAQHRRDRGLDGLRPFGFGHERGRVLSPGEPRNRTSQAEEPEALRNCDRLFHLLLHGADRLPGGRPDPRRGTDHPLLE